MATLQIDNLLDELYRCVQNLAEDQRLVNTLVSSSFEVRSFATFELLQI